jgi:hypothetical protein
MSQFVNQMVENFITMSLFQKCIMVFYTTALVGFIVSYSFIVFQMVKYGITNLIKR